jgi:hypothetical protein
MSCSRHPPTLLVPQTIVCKRFAILENFMLHKLLLYILLHTWANMSNDFRYVLESCMKTVKLKKNRLLACVALLLHVLGCCKHMNEMMQHFLPSASNVTSMWKFLQYWKKSRRVRGIVQRSDDPNFMFYEDQTALEAQIVGVDPEKILSTALTYFNIVCALRLS